MKRYTFIMKDNRRINVIARTFRAACEAWEQFGLNPRNIVLMEIHD